LAAIILFPRRIIKFFNSNDIEYLIVVFSLEIFTKALYASITEEIVFRGTLLNFYAQKNKKYLGLIISSLIFGLIHISNSMVGQDISFLYILYITISGICFGLTYLNFGIVVSISSHFFGNLMIDGFVKSTNEFYYVLGIEILLCIWLFFRDRKISSKKNK
jgi:membrane protease YdiL (CAAX protease family)